MSFETVAAVTAAFGGLVWSVALFSKRIRSTCFSAPLAAMLLGIALSPLATAVIDLSTWSDPFYILEVASWLTLAVGLMAGALDLPRFDVLRRWRGLAIVVAILALRRLPGVFLLGPLLERQIIDGAEKAFYGWFGPMGVGALFYATLTVRRTGLFAVWPIVSLVIAGSVVAHGLSAAPLSRSLGQHWRRREQAEA